MGNQKSKWRKILHDAQAIWNETDLGSQASLSRFYKFVHFWVLVWKSFTRNRCPVRASALAYASLLALIPMLAVVVSVTSSLLKKEGEQHIDDFIVKFVASVIPPDMLSSTNTPVEVPAASTQTNSPPVESTNQITTPSEVITNAPAAGEHPLPGLAEDERVLKARKLIARKINDFIQNTRSGALGVTGGVLLIFAAIGMLSRIEDTLNDIWGVQRGRSWFMRIVLYWGMITLVPILLVGALGLATGPHWETTRRLLETAPWLARILFRILPTVVICFTFALLYMLIPNTKVRWRAALVGGLVGGLLFHFNNLISVLYVSRVVSNSKIYGSLGLVPVFMIGLYCGWLILLFGAQVAYAFQNRATYLEEKQVENINQRGREFVALRLMTCIGQRFLLGEPPATVVEIGVQLNVPTRLVQQTMGTLADARLVVETIGSDPAFVPARPLEHITCHDVLFAMRATQGQDLATRDEPTRSEVYGEFSRIEEVERAASSAVTILALAHRASAKQINSGEVDGLAG